MKQIAKRRMLTNNSMRPIITWTDEVCTHILVSFFTTTSYLYNIYCFLFASYPKCPLILPYWIIKTEA